MPGAGGGGGGGDAIKTAHSSYLFLKSMDLKPLM